MAIDANSTPAPERTLLREAAAPGRLLPRPEQRHQREAQLLAILDAGPLPHAFMTAQKRQAVDDGIDALIAYLDAIEPDPDLEETGDLEPYMSRPESGTGGQGANPCSGEDECEDCGDHEPSLGAPERGNGYSQASWACGTRNDLELECEDEGADVQSLPHDADAEEPDLGSPEIHHDQRRWGQGRQGSREMDHDEQHLAAFGWQELQAIKQARREAESLLRRRGLRSALTLVPAGNLVPIDLSLLPRAS